MNIIFQIEGGLGKSIMATAIVTAIKTRYKNANLIVVTGYADIFLNNPHIHETYDINQTNGLYLKYIKNQNCKIFASEPYKDTKGITTYGVGQTGKWIDKSFRETFSSLGITVSWFSSPFTSVAIVCSFAILFIIYYVEKICMFNLYLPLTAVVIINVRCFRELMCLSNVTGDISSLFMICSLCTLSAYQI